MSEPLLYDRAAYIIVNRKRLTITINYANIKKRWDRKVFSSPSAFKIVRILDFDTTFCEIGN